MRASQAPSCAVLLLVIGKEVALPAILHNALSTASDVHALAFPLTALILLGIGLGLGALGSGLTSAASCACRCRRGVDTARALERGAARRRCLTPP